MQTTSPRKTVGFKRPWNACPGEMYNHIMPGNAFMILSHLSNKRDDDLRAVASYADLMNVTGLCRTTVKKHLKWLVVNGWIEKEPRLGYTGKQIGIYYKIIELPFGVSPENEVKEAIKNNKSETAEERFKLLKESIKEILTDDEADALDKIKKLLNKIDTENVPEKKIEQEEKQPENTEEIPGAINPKTPTKPIKEPQIEVKKETGLYKQVKIYGEFEQVKLTNNEHLKLEKKYGIELTERMISELDSYIASSGAHYDSHYATIIRWIKKEKKEKEQPSAPQNARRNKFANFKPRERDFDEIERLEQEYLIRSVEQKE